MRFTTAMLTRPGGHEVNEDRCNFLETGGFSCWVVADGLGGMGGGELASQLAADAMLSAFRLKPAVSQAVLAETLQAADAAIHAGRGTDQRLRAMSSTAVILVADGARAQWAHVGDSRLYHFRDGAVRAQTLDHSVPQLLVERGEISAAAIRGHEDRNRLTMSLGSSNHCRPTILATPVALAAGDAFLLLSDGVWEYVTEREMEADLAAAESPAAWIERIETRLLRRAEKDHDNYTAVGIFVSVDSPAGGKSP